MTVTRQDLRSFDRLATELVLGAQARGARVRISNRGHAIVYANGSSASVSPNLCVANRAAQNAKAAIARLFREKP